MRNYKEHDLIDIKSRIERDGYCKYDILYFVNYYKDTDLKDYFKKHNITFRFDSTEKYYIFTKLYKDKPIIIN